MMAQYLDPADRPKIIPAERYHRFYEVRELPPRAQIWMARRNGEGPWPIDAKRRELFIGERRPPGPNAYVSSFAVGHVAFVYWGHEVENGALVNLGDGMKPYLLPIWPDITASPWPPWGLLGADGLSVVTNNLVAMS
jgi:hypothetical protein